MLRDDFKIQRFSGPDVKKYIHELAALRIKIFRDYPYLYQGDLEYEEKYLKTYTDCPASVLILVFAGKKVVGASSAIPLKFETPGIQKPFLNANYPIDTIFYFGESVLLHECRGHKIGEHFFSEREAAAKEQGYSITAFCAVKRPPNDARRPPDFHPLDPFWQRMGYTRHDDLIGHISWTEIGAEKETDKPMTFWLKTL